MGRHTRPKPTPVNKRICQYCSSKAIDDELHFVLKCTKNSNERKRLFAKLPPDTTNLKTNDLFVYLFNNNNECLIRALGIFLFESMSARHQTDSGLVSSCNET